ncbi:hypothetical protein R1flu_015220 [Riccia fluitans]|uniref:Uncharacterized protein n=1 Tax=Riccia fluitans TaxID=41844 RepID=A0ABD1YLJ9_9MARC
MLTYFVHIPANWCRPRIVDTRLSLHVKFGALPISGRRRRELLQQTFTHMWYSAVIFNSAQAKVQTQI